MITNSGKELIAKFLLGQVPAFATHIAVGIGARPASDLPRQITARKVANNVVELTSPGHGYRIKDIVNIYISNNNIFNGNYELVDVTKDTFSYILEHEDNDNVAETGLARLAIGNKDVLDFEVVRIPITSRGYVNDGGVTKIVFAAELPSDDRLLISEAALWSAGSNTNAQYADSRLLYNFGPAEGWKYHHGLTVEDVPVKTFMANEPPDINAPLVGKAFITASDTPVMTNASRANRYEPGRYLSNGIALRGDTSKIVSTSNTRHGALSLDSLYENEHVHRVEGVSERLQLFRNANRRNRRQVLLAARFNQFAQPCQRTQAARQAKPDDNHREGDDDELGKDHAGDDLVG